MSYFIFSMGLIKKIGGSLLTKGSIMLMIFSFVCCADNRIADYQTPVLNYQTNMENDFIVPEGWQISLWAESPPCTIQQIWMLTKKEGFGLRKQ